jgi:23S rRNA pseudouridine1911/1915/1917 synthase
VTPRVERVPDALAGQRLDRIVAMITGASRAEAAALVRDGRVEVDGEVRTNGASRVDAGATVNADHEPAPAARPEPDPGVGLEIVHTDEHVIVVDKQAGLVVHPGAGNPDGTLVNGILARFPEVAEVGEPDRPGVVHRLDKGTSGLLVVARSQAAYDGLVEQLAGHEVERRYLALAWGEAESPSGLIDAPIGRSQRDPTRMAVSNRGKPARTTYEVLAVHHSPVPTTLFGCRLETGRTHQVRVHLMAIGHPVVGDDRYGGRRQAIACARPFLHATRLAFAHPVTGEPLAFDSPLPPDLQSVLDGLGG